MKRRERDARIDVTQGDYRLLLSPFRPIGKTSSVAVRTRDNVYRYQLADTLCRCGTCIGRGFTGCNITTNHGGTQAAANLLNTNQLDARSFNHRVRSLNQCNQPRVSIIPNASIVLSSLSGSRTGPFIQPVFVNCFRGSLLSDAAQLPPAPVR